MTDTVTAAPAFLSLVIHIEHQHCQKAEEWRKAGGDGFPRMLPVLHERYNSYRNYFKCEACDTVISHSLANVTNVESA